MAVPKSDSNSRKALTGFLLALVLPLAACGWTTHAEQKQAVAVPAPPSAGPNMAAAEDSWGVLDQGIASIEKVKGDAAAAADRTRRDRWMAVRMMEARTIRSAADALPKLDASLDDLDLLALVSRPEIKADKKDLAGVKALRDDTLKSFPRIGDVLSQNLTDGQWSGFIRNFTDGLVRIYTVPLVMKDESSRALLQTMQTRAMTAAVLAQVHLAYRDYHEALATAGAAPSPETVALAWDRYALLMQSLGADALPSDVQVSDLGQLSAVVRERLEKTDPVAIRQWALYAQNQTGLADSVPAMSPARADTGLVPDIDLAGYTPDSPLPLPQKLSAHTQEEAGAGRFAQNPASFLTVSRWQVRSLLDAPISEP